MCGITGFWGPGFQAEAGGAVLRGMPASGRCILTIHTIFQPGGRRV